MIRKIKNKEELIECVKLYIKYNNEDLMPSDLDTAIKHMKRFMSNGAFLRVIEDDGKIMAWILAITTSKEFIKEPVLQQIFYGSDYTGVKAAKAVISLHNAMIDEACKRNIDFLISTGSHIDEQNVFTRILARAGWKRAGYVATFRPSQHETGAGMR